VSPRWPERGSLWWAAPWRRARCPYRKQQLGKRGRLAERCFAGLYETEDMRQTSCAGTQTLSSDWSFVPPDST